jgi:A/G-specific adenine glycosylase
MTIGAFKKKVYSYYRSHRRDFPWRSTHDPYRILVSEIMLQQTQAPRVVQPFEKFVAQFPSVEVLAKSSSAKVIRAWQGLGYNRRALNLHRTAKVLQEQYGGVVPSDPEKLVALPGIGPATAAAIGAFAFNRPGVLIETNVRSVFIHFFFPKRKKVSDSELLPLIEKSVDQEQPREWYYALMDYGVMLKATSVNPSRRSRHHKKQSAFKGSDRQLRGAILRSLALRTHTRTRLAESVRKELHTIDQKKFERQLAALLKEGFLEVRGQQISIARG